MLDYEPGPAPGQKVYRLLPRRSNLTEPGRGLSKNARGGPLARLDRTRTTVEGPGLSGSSALVYHNHYEYKVETEIDVLVPVWSVDYGLVTTGDRAFLGPSVSIFSATQ